MGEYAGTNRREHPRYKIKSDVFLTFRPQFKKIGKLRDISRGGVAFEYTLYEEMGDYSDVEVDIFSASKDIHIMRVPCKVVYDFPIETYPSFNNIVTRRCGLRFLKLSDQQMSQIKSFININDPISAMNT